MYSRKSQRNLDEIYMFIQEDNIIIAERVIENIRESINTLLHFPLIGIILDAELWIRSIVETTFKYRITYHFDGKNIIIFSIYKYIEH